MTTEVSSRERHRPGDIRDAIVDLMEVSGAPLTLREIYEGVNERVGAAETSSIRSYLRLNEGKYFERVGRGQYVLMKVFGEELPPAEVTLAFECGDAAMYLGDSLDWLRSQPDRSIHAIVTDPPYGLLEYSAKEQRKLREGQGGVWRIPPSYDGHERSPLPRFTVLTAEDLRELSQFFQRFARAVFPKLVPGANVVIASNPLVSYIVSAAVASAGFERRGEIARLVMTMRGGDRPKNAHLEFTDVSVIPRSMWEPWLIFRKPVEGRVQDNLRKWGTGGFRRVSATQPFGDVIQSHPTRPAEKRLAPHPSLKPQSYLRQIVRAVLPLGSGVIVDPFAGSGSTLAAAEAIGYRSIGVELDPEYVAMARSAIPALRGLRVGGAPAAGKPSSPGASAARRG